VQSPEWVGDVLLAALSLGPVADELEVLVQPEKRRGVGLQPDQDQLVGGGGHLLVLAGLEGQQEVLGGVGGLAPVEVQEGLGAVAVVVAGQGGDGRGEELVGVGVRSRVPGGGEGVGLDVVGGIGLAVRTGRAELLEGQEGVGAVELAVGSSEGLGDDLCGVADLLLVAGGVEEDPGGPEGVGELALGPVGWRRGGRCR